MFELLAAALLLRSPQPTAFVVLDVAISYIPSSQASIFGGGISMIFLRTTGNEVCAPVAVSIVIMTDSPDMFSKKSPTERSTRRRRCPVENKNSYPTFVFPLSRSSLFKALEKQSLPIKTFTKGRLADRLRQAEGRNLADGTVSMFRTSSTFISSAAS